jgi:hypothetical protein
MANWTMIPCLTATDRNNDPPRFTNSCALTEGDEPGDHHTHWIDPDGIEVVVAWHKAGERPEPNCVIRKNGH